jgi:hypothetical protein
MRGLALVVGPLLVVAGTVFALQGFGVIGGSGMTGSGFWAAAGPVIAVIGLALVLAGSRRRRSSLSSSSARRV